MNVLLQHCIRAYRQFYRICSFTCKHITLRFWVFILTTCIALTNATTFYNVQLNSQSVLTVQEAEKHKHSLRTTTSVCIALDSSTLTCRQNPYKSFHWVALNCDIGRTSREIVTRPMWKVEHYRQEINLIILTHWAHSNRDNHGKFQRWRQAIRHSVPLNAFW